MHNWQSASSCAVNSRVIHGATHGFSRVPEKPRCLTMGSADTDPLEPRDLALLAFLTRPQFLLLRGRTESAPASPSSTGLEIWLNLLTRVRGKQGLFLCIPSSHLCPSLLPLVCTGPPCIHAGSWTSVHTLGLCVLMSSGALSPR